MTKRRLLITGSTGFLGRAVVAVARESGEWITIGTARKPAALSSSDEPDFFESWDLSREEAPTQLLEKTKPEAVIHTAAAGDAAFCRKETVASRKINVVASIDLAEKCAERSIPFLITSTDLVFDGTQAPYEEMAAPSPLSEYGRQKVEAERGIQEVYPDAVVARVALLFGPPAPERPAMLARLAEMLRGSGPVRLFVDEFRSPLSTRGAARILLSLLGNASGLVHVGGERRVSRYELGRALAEVWGIDPERVKPIRQDEVPTAVPRPRDVSFETKRLRELGIPPPPFEEDLFEARERDGGVR
ncbi:MAG: NAD(P)-dependent oxidoreductase [Candidatus Hydrogenedentota bacterium]|nr:MAG: NAD(P)-dependent oxidoreductase [Candidatus Hydrogenedentota bacterium]